MRSCRRCVATAERAGAHLGGVPATLALPRPRRPDWNRPLSETFRATRAMLRKSKAKLRYFPDVSATISDVNELGEADCIRSMQPMRSKDAGALRKPKSLDFNNRPEVK